MCETETNYGNCAVVRSIALAGGEKKLGIITPSFGRGRSMKCQSIYAAIVART